MDKEERRQLSGDKPEGDQTAALFGNFAIGMSGYLGVGLVVLLIAFLTAITSHFTVMAHLKRIET
jgi:cell division transport system permease protein